MPANVENSTVSASFASVAAAGTRLVPVPSGGAANKKYLLVMVSQLAGSEAATPTCPGFSLCTNGKFRDTNYFGFTLSFLERPWDGSEGANFTVASSDALDAFGGVCVLMADCGDLDIAVGTEGDETAGLASVVTTGVDRLAIAACIGPYGSPSDVDLANYTRVGGQLYNGDLLAVYSYLQSTAGATPIDIPSFSAGTTVAYVTATFETAGGGGPSAPTLPTSVVAVAGNAEATVSWVDGTGSPAPDALVSYRINGGSWSADTTIANAVETLTETGLTNGDTIRFRVAMTNSEGTTVYVESNDVVPTAPPSSDYVDGFTAFLALHDPHTAVKLNSTDQGTQFGNDPVGDWGGYGGAIYSSATGFPNDALNQQEDPPQNTDFDSYTLTDACFLLYVPSGLASGTTYGLFHNGGGTNAQSGWIRNNGGTYELCMNHNASGSNQDDLIYVLPETDRWYAVGFQYEDNAGGMAIWIDGVEVATTTRVYGLLYGSGNPDLGNSGGDEPSGWGANNAITNSGLLLAQLVIDNPNKTNSSPAGNGDSFYIDYASTHMSTTPSSPPLYGFGGGTLSVVGGGTLSVVTSGGLEQIYP